jgi:hypothetical protein
VSSQFETSSNRHRHFPTTEIRQPGARLGRSRQQRKVFYVVATQPSRQEGHTRSPASEPRSSVATLTSHPTHRHQYRQCQSQHANLTFSASKELSHASLRSAVVTISRYSDSEVNGTTYHIIQGTSCGSVVGVLDQAFWHASNAVDQIQRAVSEIYKMMSGIGRGSLSRSSSACWKTKGRI